MLTARKIHGEVFWIVTPCSVVVGYLHIQGEDGDMLDLRNVGILPEHYTASQLRRPRGSSPPWRPQIQLPAC